VPFLSARSEEERSLSSKIEIPSTIRAADAAGAGIPLSRLPDAERNGGHPALLAYQALATRLLNTEVANAL
jgi:hypothetical protein